jgi:hypothetical protein
MEVVVIKKIILSVSAYRKVANVNARYYLKNRVFGCVKIRDVVQNEMWFNYQISNLKLNLT